MSVVLVFGLLFAVIFTGLHFPPLFITEKVHEKNYNVIIISIDSLRADHLGSYGYFRNTTPIVDQFAESAILFENAITQGAWTLPSYVSLFTSTYPSTHKVTALNRRISDEQKVLAEVLKADGYKTVAFAENPAVRPESGFDRGFDAYNFRLNGSFSYEDLKRSGMNAELADIGNFLMENHDEKFFLFIQLEGVHSPYLPNSPYDKIFDPEYNGSMPSTDDFYKIYHGLCVNDSKLCSASLESLYWLIADNQPVSLIANYPGKTGEDTYMHFINENNIKVYNHDHIIALYDGHAREVDDFFGELVKKMETYDLLNKSIVIFTSDHGEEFYEHGKYIHAGAHNEILHVPLIISYPGMPEKDSREIFDAKLIDVMPTIFDILGLPLTGDVKKQMEGRSLIPLIENRKAATEQDIISESNVMGVYKKSIISGEWKLIHDMNTGKSELYNIQEDPEERNNVSGTYPEITDDMKTRLFSFIMGDRK